MLIDFCLIFVPFGHYDEPEILRYAITSICPKGADVRQERAYGGHSAGVRRWLRSLAEELRQTGTIESKSTTSVKPGTRLVREWQGAIHEVTASDDGFIYRDQRYRSLSQIARTITGTRWSGPAFFGLSKVKAAVKVTDGA